jgi:hypothetical protein
MSTFYTSWAREDDVAQRAWQSVLDGAQAGSGVDVQETWEEVVPFDRPQGSTGYAATSTDDSLLGLLPFYDYLYVPISTSIVDEVTFTSQYGIGSEFFIDLAEAGRVVPVFHASHVLYSPFVARDLWAVLEARGVNYLLAGHINALAVSFQSTSGLMMPWEDKSRDPWWTEMLVKASALQGRLLANPPSNAQRFLGSLADFRRLRARLEATPYAIEGQKLTYVSKALGLNYPHSDPPIEDYLKVLDSRTTRTLRRLFESPASLGPADGPDEPVDLVSICKGYNEQIEALEATGSYKFLRLTSDLFSKHLWTLLISIGATAVGTPLTGLTGLIASGVAQKAAATLQKDIESDTAAQRSLMGTLSEILGHDSSLVHLCLAREAIKQ